MELKLDSILIGRTLAGVVILLALVSAIVGAAQRGGGFDQFLFRLTTPRGVGFLISVATKILRTLDRTPESHWTAPRFRWTTASKLNSSVLAIS